MDFFFFNAVCYRGNFYLRTSLVTGKQHLQHKQATEIHIDFALNIQTSAVSALKIKVQ